MKRHSSRRVKLATLIVELTMFVGVLGFALSGMLVPSRTYATPGLMPFGGPITVVNMFTVIVGCPPHIVVSNYANMGIPVGLAPVPSTIYYRYGNLVKPGTFVLGNYTPVPIPCLVPYPVFPIAQIGTGAF